MTSSSFQFLPLFPVFDYSFECHILSLHQFAQQVHSFPTSSSLPLHSSPDYIMQTINLWSSRMLNMGTSQLVTRSTRHTVKSCEELTVLSDGVVTS